MEVKLKWRRDVEPAQKMSGGEWFKFSFASGRVVSRKTSIPIFLTPQMADTKVHAPTPAPLYPQASVRQQPAPVFEFTKRKKWADLLVTELAGTIILVLSPNAEVLYCGAAAVELLGWKEEDVIDTELAHWMHGMLTSPAGRHEAETHR